MRQASGIVMLGLSAALVTACATASATAVPVASAATTAERPAVQRALTARNVELQPTDLTAPAGIDIIVAFDNMDPGVPHGLALYADAAHTITLGSAPVVVGPDHQSIHVAGLAPGRYQFSCVVHPMMTADLIVGP